MLPSNENPGSTTALRRHRRRRRNATTLSWFVENRRERKTKEPYFPITEVNEATTFYYCKALPEKKGTMSGPGAPPEEQGILQEDHEKTAVAGEDMINIA
ncbi:hypothetical protein MRB53_030453 [Persea americana]|uniref:Uncharacterized protein n=1 Tax=Persea americana TaxID=3435 RepID=A0ACC2KLA2_PERAE|nr:hypothetical protein MRB53_030453 [Persea americana]